MTTPCEIRLRTPTREAISQAASLLAAGELVAFPTETVYGLGANAYSEEATQKIYRAKGRPATNPLIVHIASLSFLELVTTSDEILRIESFLEKLSAFIPGALSLVIKKNEKLCHAVTAGLGTVAVRVPKHPVAQELLSKCPFPVAAPSANPSNYISPTTAQHVIAQLGSSVPLVLDGGSSDVGVESTILDLSSEWPKVLRPGVISAEMLAEALSCSVTALLLHTSVKEISAPGMLAQHYTPDTPLKAVRGSLPTGLPKNYGLITMQNQSNLIPRPLPLHWKALSASGDMHEICHNLFKTLREFDSLGLDLILIEECAREGIGRAIMDRIDRASARTASNEG